MAIVVLPLSGVIGDAMFIAAAPMSFQENGFRQRSHVLIQAEAQTSSKAWQNLTELREIDRTVRLRHP
ncbi:hypothetical protein NKI77_16195 [Mesorhizobium opportunistum]|uniref:Uncharacterized protein n=1 Tax=Mesorhizobium opportunistum TaxID=593909 RepID=A0ABV1YGY1_9HYPH|nr:hypothetical protein [Mesorhizobium sp.]TIN92806.1 MAG: hypothetical protein E5Y06_21835 [Mesorhizobium sp.]TJU97308.1 MAG: hypothetical protein E5Y08_17400 [Mesorhizobium sp.]TJV04624.1 MAG: hypothetical protein E5Y12_11915 [Mesorhizobium sp.]TJV16570.1 MAG: hypothetical protein E5Y07_17305 [Mesorhizobium sp.]TJV41684.1 MAG: hypothetical protein E5Y02_17475 [Mesorhizobium sp.]